MKKYKIKKYERTCDACPSQWDIWTESDEYIYGRYRWGNFSITLNAFDKEKEEQVLMTWNGRESLDGYMTDEEMIKLTEDVLDWSDFMNDEEVEIGEVDEGEGNTNPPEQKPKTINLSALMRIFPGFVWWENVAELCGINFETKQFIVIDDGMCVSYPDDDHPYSWLCHGYNLPEIPENWKKLKYMASGDKYMEEWVELNW